MIPEFGSGTLSTRVDVALPLRLVETVIIESPGGRSIMDLMELGRDLAGSLQWAVASFEAGAALPVIEME